MALKFRRFLMPVALAAHVAAGAHAEGRAQEDAARQAFIEANLLSIFYHELGHALIDLEEVPIFGQEEDAADVFSILLVDSLFDEATAQAIAGDAAYGFLGEVYLMEAQGAPVAWWDVHGPDEQRFFNTVCLFYGANPDKREGFARAFGLPDDRGEYCPAEYDQAIAAWGGVLDGITARFEEGQGEALVLMPYAGEQAPLTAVLLEGEVAALNAEIRLAAPLSVWLEPCGEPNAFYDPEIAGITMCSEFEAHLHELYDLVAE